MWLSLFTKHLSAICFHIGIQGVISLLVCHVYRPMASYSFSACMSESALNVGTFVDIYSDWVWFVAIEAVGIFSSVSLCVSCIGWSHQHMAECNVDKRFLWFPDDTNMTCSKPLLAMPMS